jgi:GntR family transcriptional regulator/MocR family aminotransferase
VYRGRRTALLESLARELGDLAAPGPSDAGLYLRLVLAEGLDEEAVTHRAAERGVAVYPARPYFTRPVERPGLILGYAALDEAGIEEGIRRLRLAIDDVRGTTSGTIAARPPAPIQQRAGAPIPRG